MKIETTRRKALAIFGLGAASAPAAIKQIADKATMDLAGIRAANILPGVASNAPAPFSFSNSEQAGLSYEDIQDRAAEFFDLFGFPQHILNEMADRQSNIDVLDFDLAQKKSWSLAAKLYTQRERNLKRQTEQMRKDLAQRKSRKLFKTVSGYDWPFYV